MVSKTNQTNVFLQHLFNSRFCSLVLPEDAFSVIIKSKEEKKMIWKWTFTFTDLNVSCDIWGNIWDINCMFSCILRTSTGVWQSWAQTDGPGGQCHQAAVSGGRRPSTPQNVDQRRTQHPQWLDTLPHPPHGPEDQRGGDGWCGDLHLQSNKRLW